MDNFWYEESAGGYRANRRSACYLMWEKVTKRRICCNKRS